MMLPEWYEDKEKQGLGWDGDKAFTSAVDNAAHLSTNVHDMEEKRINNDGCARFIMNDMVHAANRNDVLRVIQAYLVMTDSIFHKHGGDDKDMKGGLSKEELDKLELISAKLKAAESNAHKGKGVKGDNVPWSDGVKNSGGVKVAIHKIFEATKREGGVEENVVVSRESEHYGMPLLIEVSVKKANAETLNMIKSVLEKFNDYPYPIFIYYPGISDYAMKRLSWEDGFVCIDVIHPKPDYYKKCFDWEIDSEEKLLADDIDPAELIYMLMSFRGSDFTDRDIAVFVKRAVMNAERNKHERLEFTDFLITEFKGHIGYKDMLNALYGQEDVKNKLQRLIALRRFSSARSKSGIEFPLHTIFTGPPGVGKTSFAEAYSCGLAEEGITNGKFMKCCKADLVGKYVGHTADKIAAMFGDEGAKGGVIFVDEADCLMTNDSFAGEVVKEFVRYMESDASTVVIFAIYESRVEDFYELDPGLKSRISNVINFKSYTNEELLSIFHMLADKEGFIIKEEDVIGCDELISGYIDRIKDNDNFANAREVRIIMQHYIEQVAFDSFMEKTDPNDIEFMDISKLKRTISELKGERCDHAKPVLGFASM